jgi:hypothetical protein
MNIVITILSLFMHLVFLYKREWLFDKKLFLYLTLISIVLFVVSFVLLKLDLGDPKFTPALKMPLFALGVFFILNKIFVVINQRNPQDTFWSMDLSLMRDGIFNFLFWFLGTMIPAFLIYFIHI